MKKIINIVKLILILSLSNACALPVQAGIDGFCLRPIAEAHKGSSAGSGIHEVLIADYAEGRSVIALGLPLGVGQAQDISDTIEETIERVVRQVHADSTEAEITGSDWSDINYHLRRSKAPVYEGEKECRIYIVDAEKALGWGAFGFPLVRDGKRFYNMLPIISTTSKEDGVLCIYMTRRFYDDYIEQVFLSESIMTRQAKMMRLAEIIDREGFRHSEGTQALSAKERFMQAAKRAKNFIPRKDKISAYHQWIINRLAFSDEGRGHLEMLVSRVPTEEQDPYQEAVRSHIATDLQYRGAGYLIQRQAYHIFHAYRFGDQQALERICSEAGVSHLALQDHIARHVKKHLRRIVASFSPDQIIMKTSETVTELDFDLPVARKTPKSQELYDIASYVFPMVSARGVLNELVGEFDPSDPGRQLDQRKVNFVYDVMVRLRRQEYEERGVRFLTPAREPIAAPEVKQERIRQYVKALFEWEDLSLMDTSQHQILDSYEHSTQELGGLVVSYEIIDNRIYPEVITPVLTYLFDLANGAGTCAHLSDMPREERRKLGEKVLEKCKEIAIEAAKRGKIVRDIKLQNIGIREDGEVVIYDLGPATFEDEESNAGDLTSYLISRAGAGYTSLRYLGDPDMSDNELERFVTTDEESLVALRESWARKWKELVSDNPDRAGWVNLPASASRAGLGYDREASTGADGLKLVDEIAKQLEQTEDPTGHYRSICFIPTETAKAKIISAIIEELTSYSVGAAPVLSAHADGTPTRTGLPRKRRVAAPRAAPQPAVPTEGAAAVRLQPRAKPSMAAALAIAREHIRWEAIGQSA